MVFSHLRVIRRWMRGTSFDGGMREEKRESERRAGGNVEVDRESLAVGIPEQRAVPVGCVVKARRYK